MIRVYNQLTVESIGIRKTTISTLFSLFEFQQRLFGLRNDGQTFQRFIDFILHRLYVICAYIDDVLVTNYSVVDRMSHLDIIHKRFEKIWDVINQSPNSKMQNLYSGRMGEWAPHFNWDRNYFTISIGGGPRGVMVKARDCGIVVRSSYSSRAITFTFGQIPLGRYEHPYPPTYGLNSTTTVLLGEWL